MMFAREFWRPSHSYVEDEPTPVENEAPPYYQDLYRHQPLESGSIRLMILAEAEHYHDELTCDIVHVSLSQEIEYTALSYVWGSTFKAKAIRVGEKDIGIGTNLDSALRHLRRRDRPIRCWVDGICINQDDVTERNHQVAQMRQIYESATETVVYLGDQKGNTSLSAWNFLERNSRWAFNEDLDKDFERPAKLEGLVEFLGSMDDVCVDVLRREWFSRVWVLQKRLWSRDKCPFDAELAAFLGTTFAE